MPLKRHYAIKQDSRYNENTHANPAELREQIRMQKLAQIETDSSVKGMSNAHYAAQMANAGPSYTTIGSNYNNNSGDPQVANQTYGTHAKLSHLGGPTGNHGPRSNGTVYGEFSYVPKGFNPTSSTRKAVKGRPSKNRINGGARKKTRKHKKESRESRKLKKSRK